MHPPKSDCKHKLVLQIGLYCIVWLFILFISKMQGRNTIVLGALSQKRTNELIGNLVGIVQDIIDFWIRIYLQSSISTLAYLNEAVIKNKSTTTLWSSEVNFTIDWSFKMRYCMSFYLNWHRTYGSSKIGLSNSLNKRHMFNFNLA